MPRRRSYTTTLIYLARQGLLPDSISRQIHRSNIHRWKQLSPDHFFGHDILTESGIPIDAGDHFAVIQHFARNTSAVRIYRAVIRLVHVFTSIAATCSDFSAQIRHHKQHIVDVIERVRPLIGMKIPLRVFGISVHTFRHWSRTLRMQCPASFHRWCRKSFPHQLLSREVLTMKTMLLSQTFAHWPIASVAWHALRSGILAASIHTWYRYATLLGIRRTRPVSRRARRRTGIRAEHPGELLHADVTRFMTACGQRCHVAIIIDNASRMVLAAKVLASVSVVHMQDLFLQARRRLATDTVPILMTDNGSENSFDEIPGSDLRQHLIAQKDIRYSNSIVEAFNRILKYDYLYRRQIPDMAALEQVVNNAVLDYNTVRPHSSLQGMTPSEVFAGRQPNRENTAQAIAAARDRRIRANRTEPCNLCP